MAHIFHVEFGINDTSLTRALENGNYASAERLILDSNNPSYLDEGCYQRTPLNICLCGVDQDAERVITRNFYLARLLIERGANINHRVPVTFFGSEFLSPGKACLELLTEYYIDLTRRSGRYSLHLNENYSRWSHAVDVVVGMNKEYLLTTEDILENVLDLIFIVLNSGGDPNLVDENRMTVLHHICMYSQDPRLLALLCNNGADVQSEDSHGNTPLLSLCDMATARLYDSFDDLSPSSDDSASSVVGPSVANPEFLDFLLLRKDLDVNHRNGLGRTALFHCMVRGDVGGAYKLLCCGADPTLRGAVWESRKRKRDVSPLLSVFAGWSVQRNLMWMDPHRCLVTAAQSFSHLVDAGYFNRPEIEEELNQLVSTFCPELLHLCQHHSRLVQLLFGRTTCSLQQLAARQLFRQCLVDSTAALQRILPVATFRQQFQPQELRQRAVYEEYMTLVVNHTVLQSLVSLLDLPADTLLCLQVELLLQQLGLRLSSLRVERPDGPVACLVGGGDDDYLSSSASDGSISQDGGDSDLEYW